MMYLISIIALILALIAAMNVRSLQDRMKAEADAAFQRDQDIQARIDRESAPEGDAHRIAIRRERHNESR